MIMKILKKALRNNKGAALIEMAFILPIMLSVTLGICEFGYVLFQNNSAQKATQIGARYAATRAPVIGNLEECFVDTSGIAAGTDCVDVPNFDTYSETCPGNGDCVQAVYDAILARMQTVYPAVQSANLEITYTSTGLGFVGRRSPVPAITVKIKDLKYDFIALNVLANLTTALNMDTAQTTVIAEDLGNGA
jgi:Flp pilus assembly protein TadG